jgi:hypothetical protein
MPPAIPEQWIIISAHGVGYTLLALAAIAALCIFGHFMTAWRPGTPCGSCPHQWGQAFPA